MYAPLKKSIDSAVAYLVSCQQDDGGFPVIRWENNGTSMPEDRLFGTACILLAVGTLLPNICLRSALRLLQNRRDVHGFWHFDAAGLLPADADDTACALASLLRFAPTAEKPTLSDVAPLAAFVRPDGRIATWLATDTLAHFSPDTEDAVVIANVIYAIALYDPQRAYNILNKWINSSILRTTLDTDLTRSMYATSLMPDVAQIATPYYMHIETAMYAWTRALKALNLQRPIFALASDVSSSPLRSALMLSATATLRQDLISFLLRSQHSSGYWVAEPWFRSPGASFGSAALTTAFAAEALNQALSTLFINFNDSNSPSINYG
jgi:hypothetical protein